MAIIDDILQKFHLKYEDLNSVEREQLTVWLDSLNHQQLTIDKVKLYISSMRDSVEQELTKIGHESKQDIFLKARLRNYMLLESFLSTPDKAKKALEQSLANINQRK